MAHLSLTMEQAALLRPFLEEIIHKDTQRDKSNNGTSIVQQTDAEESLTKSPTQAADAATAKEPAEIPAECRDSECKDLNYSTEDLLTKKRKNGKSTEAQIFFNVSTIFILNKRVSSA